MIKFVTGDLMNANAQALCNTVNTVGVMGKGIALQFKEGFPHNFQVYREACKSGQLQIGELLVVKDCNLIFGEKLIINFPTKTHWLLPSEYSYIESGLIALRACIREHRIQSIAMPALGCGNGGLNWTIVKGMIGKQLSNLDAEIAVYETCFLKKIE
jgi:O-acetyl-ADP-ribose deacetylase (regulator of RNase III)